MYIQTPTERQFDWDEVKRWSTLEKHGIDFIDAALVFDQEHLILNSGRDQENRWIAVGPLGQKWIAVVFTMRGTTTRIITARCARKRERQTYEAQITSGNPQDEKLH